MPHSLPQSSVQCFGCTHINFKINYNKQSGCEKYLKEILVLSPQLSTYCGCTLLSQATAVIQLSVQ